MIEIHRFLGTFSAHNRYRTARLAVLQQSGFWTCWRPSARTPSLGFRQHVGFEYPVPVHRQHAKRPPRQRLRSNGLLFPHPALIFKVAGRDLFVRAMTTNSRPGPDTLLKTAPYWNTDSRGLVCAGSMRVPESSDIASMSGWRDSYFQSEFTRAAGAVRLTSHPGGFIGLWRSLAGKKQFPVQHLSDAGETLQEFVAPGNER